MSNNDPQAERMKEYFNRAQEYLSEELNIEKLLLVVEEAAGIEIDPTSEANLILGRMWEAVASSVVVKGVRIEKQEDTAKIYDAADVYVKKAIACYERFVSTHPDSAEAHEALGSAYWSQDFEKALVEYELALKYDQNNPDYKKDVAHAKNLIVRGETARDNRSSWQYISTDSFLTDLSAGKMESHVKENFNKGVSLYDEGKYEESIEYFNESLELAHKLSREYTQIWYFKGHSLGHLGRKEGAIDCFEEVLSRAKDPDDLMEIHGLLGRLILLGTLEEPKYIPTKGDLSDDELRKALKHLNEGIKVFEELSVEKKQEWANLYEPLEKLRELAKNLIMQRGGDEDHIGSAQRLAEEGKIDLACKEYEKALQKTNDLEDLANIHHNLGHLILFRSIGAPKYIPTKDDLSTDELRKAENHFREGIEIFKKLPLEKKQKWGELHEALENKRKLAFSLGIQKHAEEFREEVELRKDPEIKRKINNFESEIRRLNKDRNEKFNAAGQIAYSEYVKNKPSQQPPAVTAKWDEIRDIDTLIAKNKQDLDDLKQREKKSGFLAKLSDTIVSTAKQGKLKLDVYNLERKKDSVITEFGSVLYDSHKKGDKTLKELSSIWQNIDDIEQQIRKNEEELANLRKYV